MEMLEGRTEERQNEGESKIRQRVDYARHCAMRCKMKIKECMIAKQRRIERSKRRRPETVVEPYSSINGNLVHDERSAHPLHHPFWRRCRERLSPTSSHFLTSTEFWIIRTFKTKQLTAAMQIYLKEPRSNVIITKKSTERRYYSV